MSASRVRFVLSLAVLVIISESTPSPAATITIGAAKDNTLVETSSTTDAAQRTNGGGFGIYVGRTNQGFRRRGLIKFNVAASVPAGATITSAALTLNFEFTSEGSSRVLTLRRLLKDWGEGVVAGGAGGGGGNPPNPGDATWKYNFYNTSQWTSPGAGTDGSDRSATISASQTVGVLSPVFITWGPTTELTADVQYWLDNPASNFGWIIIAPETSNHASRRFSSRETDIPEWAPALTISYVPALPPIINPIPYASTVCGSPFTSVAPTLSQGSPPITWSLQAGPFGATINPANGAVSWAAPVTTSFPYTITVRATNSSGFDDESWLLTVRPGDFNGDGLLTAIDVPPFVDVLIGASTTTACAADVNLDGFIDGLDVQAFVSGL